MTFLRSKLLNLSSNLILVLGYMHYFSPTACFHRNYVIVNMLLGEFALQELLSRGDMTTFLKKTVNCKSAMILVDGEEERAKLLFSAVAEILDTSKNTVVRRITF